LVAVVITKRFLNGTAFLYDTSANQSCTWLIICDRHYYGKSG